jgi:hypothetical protein
MATETPNPPPPRAEGWYRDPKDPPGQRYWDGKEWTDHLAPPGLMLKIFCAVGAIAAVGLCTGAVWAVITDEQHVTTAGRIGAVSAGLLFAVVFLGLILNFYRKRMLKDLSETQSNGDSPD